MDIYYMHCNQMEAGHPSHGAVTPVTTPPPPHISTLLLLHCEVRGLTG